MSDAPTVIRKKYWKQGKHEYGYELGKTRSFFYVKYMWPAYFFGSPNARDIKMYKALKTAERYIARFEKQHPPITLEELQRDLADMKRKR